MSERYPEPALQVLWQRHVPQGVGTRESDARADALADLELAVEDAIDDDLIRNALDDGDLVITISVRKLEADPKGLRR